MTSAYSELTPQELERIAIGTALRSREDFGRARAAGVDVISFQVDKHQEVWAHLVERFKSDVDGTSWPGPGDIRVAFGVEVADAVDDSSSIYERLRYQAKQRLAALAINRVLPSLRENPDLAVGELIRSLSTLQTGNEVELSGFKEGAQDRLARLVDRRNMVEQGVQYGLSTGLSVFDDKNDTWKPGEVVAIQAATNVGKSWMLLKLASHVYREHGQSVLFLSPESTVEDIELRLDAILGHDLGFRLSNRALRNATFNQDEYTRYINTLSELPGMGKWLTIDSGSNGVFSFEDIVRLTLELRPDVLAIDGFHLIRSEGKSWEAMKFAAESLKGLAQSLGIVIFAAIQANRNSMIALDDVPGVGDVAYGLGLSQAANRVISLARMTGQPNGRVFQVIKNRDGELVEQSQVLKFDVDVGDIRQIDPKKTGFDETTIRPIAYDDSVGFEDDDLDF